MATPKRPRLRTRLTQLLAVALIGASLGACSGGGGNGGGASAAAGTGCSGNAAADCGQVLVAATDAAGDFASYTVDVVSVTLKRSDGTTVETLPDTTTIDFAQLTDLSTLLGSATLAPGDYVGGTIRLDYGSKNTDLQIQQGSGTEQAVAVDSNGNKLGVVNLDLRFADNGHLIVRRHETSLLSLDFNLAASNSIVAGGTGAAAGSPQVKVQPYISASVVPPSGKPLRVRGALQSVDTANNSYDVQVRPWHRMHGDHGVVTVHTTDATDFDVNAEHNTGSQGLAALAKLPQGTLTVALGSLNTSDHSFTADTVYAGDSVGGVRSDTVFGHVVARSGSRLTVKAGIAVHHDDGHWHFARTVVVDVGADTAVSREGDPNAMLDAGDISVGQRIVAFGTFSATAAATTDPNAPTDVMQLDATSGRVRLLTTRLDGTVNSVMAGQAGQAGQIEMDVHDIDHLNVGLFDFSGTGANADADADPMHYQIDTGSLTLDGIAAGQAASVLGFVRPFGTAAPLDFDARSIINPGSLPALLSLSWGTSGSKAAFDTMQDTDLVLNLQGLGDRHFLRSGFTQIDLTSLASLTITGRTGNWSGYGIVNGKDIELYGDFISFVKALRQDLGGNEAVQSLTAFGIYDNGTNTLAAGHVIVRMVTAGGYGRRARRRPYAPAGDEPLHNIKALRVQAATSSSVCL